MQKQQPTGGDEGAKPRKLRHRAEIPAWAQDVRARRRQLGLTQQQVADLAGIAERTVIAVERGTGGVSLHNVLRVLDVLGLGLSVARGQGQIDVTDA